METTASADEAVAPRSLLMVSARGPVDLHMTDPLGRELGSIGQRPGNEIPLGVSAQDSVGIRYLIIGLPLSGEYTFQVRGRSSGAYTVLGQSYSPAGSAEVLNLAGQATPGRRRRTYTATIVGENQPFIYLPRLMR